MVVRFTVSAEESREHPSLTDLGNRAENVRALETDESREYSCLPDSETEPRIPVVFRRKDCNREHPCY